LNSGVFGLNSGSLYGGGLSSGYGLPHSSNTLGGLQFGQQTSALFKPSQEYHKKW
jgi:hypothetical protein